MSEEINTVPRVLEKGMWAYIYIPLITRVLCNDSMWVAKCEPLNLKKILLLSSHMKAEYLAGSKFLFPIKVYRMFKAL